jgi:type VI secretion system protein ImpH
MATGRRTSVPVIEQLKERAFEFQFAQAVRLLERVAAGSGNGEHAGVKRAGRLTGVGFDYAPGDEIVHFRANQSLNFPPGEVTRLITRPRLITTTGPIQGEHRAGTIQFDTDIDAAGHAIDDPVEEEQAASVAVVEDEDALPDAYDMVVSFFGLTGPSGVLPSHYTTALLSQVRNRDEAMRDFFDLFNHRLISLFYRTIEKHFYPLAFERTRRERDREHDTLTQVLSSLIGMGTPDLRKRMSVLDENLLYFSGHFSRAPRSAIALEQVIREYFQVDCEVMQFQGQWLRLVPEDLSRMPTAKNPEGLNAQLGVSTIMGSAVWDVQSRLRVRIGPLSFDRFVEFTPARRTLHELCELIRLYVGMEFEFDVQPILRRENVPKSRLGGDTDRGTRLGWTSWLNTAPSPNDFTSAVFTLNDV